MGNGRGRGKSQPPPLLGPRATAVGFVSAPEAATLLSRLSSSAQWGWGQEGLGEFTSARFDFHLIAGDEAVMLADLTCSQDSWNNSNLRMAGVD